MAPRGSYRPMSGSEPEIAASMAASEVAEAYRRCPECGSERYTQQPIRR